MFLGPCKRSATAPWNMPTYMEVHTEGHSSSAPSVLIYGRTAVTIDGRKVSTRIHPHEFKVICGFLLNSVGNDEIFLRCMACPNSLAL